MSIREKIKALSQFSACDVSDALLRLQTDQGPPFGGHLAGLSLKVGSSGSLDKIVGQAMTVKYVSIASADTSPPGYTKSADIAPPDYTPAAPGGEYVDMVKPGSIVVIDQEKGISTALIGALMATRMKLKGAKAIIVAGNVRDVADMKHLKLPIWAKGNSPVSYTAEAKVMDINVSISPQGVKIEPGDIMFCDPVEGIVRIPLHLLDEVVSLVPHLAKADDLIHKELLRGVTFRDAINKHRK